MAEGAESVPMISISGEAEDENFSLSDSEEANKAKTLIASRMRRRQKKKNSSASTTSTISNNLKRSSLIVDDGDESCVTDVETVDCEQDEPESPLGSPVEDLSPIIDAALKPQMVQIIDDQQGQVHIRSIVKTVVASLQDGSDASEMSEGEDSPGVARPNAFLSAATDIESLENSSAEEIDSGNRSDTSEMNNLIGQLELGGQVDTQDKEELAKQQNQRASSTAVGPGGLLCPKSAAGRKKMRKSRKKKSSTAGGSASTPLLAVSTPDDPVTDIEDISGVSGGTDEEDLSEKLEGAVGGPLPPTLTVGGDDDEGVTDIEDLNFSEDESGPYLGTPGIVVTIEASDTESHDCSGRSSRLGLTDVETLSDNEVPFSSASGLVIPAASDDPVTDVEDIDGVEAEEAAAAPPPPPPNGPARHGAHRQVIEIEEDENGVVTSRKYARSPNMLSLAVQTDEAGVSDIENISCSGDEDHEHDHDTPAIDMEQLDSSSSVRVQRHSISDQPPDIQQEESTSLMSSSLMPPGQAADILTDTEDMEMSDTESSMHPGRLS